MKRSKVVRPSTTKTIPRVKIEADRAAVTREFRDARTRAGLTQEQAAALRENRAPSTISHWETGSMPKTWEDLSEYAHALGQEIVLRFGPRKRTPRPDWAEGLIDDVPATRAGVERVEKKLELELAALKVALEAIQEGLEPSDDDPVDDPPPAHTTGTHDR